MARRNSSSVMRVAHDAIPDAEITDIAFCAWVAQAEPGEALVYYRGFLVVDTETELGGLSVKERRALRALADAAFRAAQQGLVHLVQVRMATDRFDYLAIARPKPREPKSKSLVRLLAAA
ncbi:MAG: hypothetical protein ACNA7M_14555 [Roseovarius sp.]